MNVSFRVFFHLFIFSKKERRRRRMMRRKNMNKIAGDLSWSSFHSFQNFVSVKSLCSKNRNTLSFGCISSFYSVSYSPFLSLFGILLFPTSMLQSFSPRISFFSIKVLVVLSFKFMPLSPAQGHEYQVKHK